MLEADLRSLLRSFTWPWRYNRSGVLVTSISFPCHLPSGLPWLFCVQQGKGTRKSILTRIMVSRSEIDMKRIKDEYKKAYGATLYRAILVSKRDIDNEPFLHALKVCDIHVVYKTTGGGKWCTVWTFFKIFLFFRMTLPVTTRRFCLLSVGVKTNRQSMGSRLIHLKSRPASTKSPIILWHILCPICSCGELTRLVSTAMLKC